MVKNSDERKQKVFLSLGSNLGDRLLNLKQALVLIEKRIGFIADCSSCYETEAWGKEDLLPFLNIVVEVRTALLPQLLLKACLLIEKELGRKRTYAGSYENRIMDVDILYYNEDIIDLPELKVPHPLMHKRAFVLIPLVEIAPHQLHPVLQKSSAQLLELVEDQMSVKRYNRPI